MTNEVPLPLALAVDLSLPDGLCLVAEKQTSEARSLTVADFGGLAVCAGTHVAPLTERQDLITETPGEPCEYSVYGMSTRRGAQQFP